MTTSSPRLFAALDVPLAIRLDRLHLAIPAAIGWSNTHLYEIRARDVGWGEPTPTGATARSTRAKPASAT